MNATTVITRTAAGTLTTRPTITRHGVTRRTTFTPAPAPRDFTATAEDTVDGRHLVTVREATTDGTPGRILWAEEFNTPEDGYAAAALAADRAGVRLIATA